jgi:hypothetical protein
MYARIENGLAVEYPLYEGDLQRRFPDLKFPMDTHGTPIPQSYVRVKVYMPEADYNYRYAETMPVLDGDEYRQEYTVTPLTDKEKADQTEFVGYRVKQRRDELLTKSDVYVLIDRWLAYTEIERASWTAYRQTLRDISNQPGFPYVVNWPTKP